MYSTAPQPPSPDDIETAPLVGASVPMMFPSLMLMFRALFQIWQNDREFIDV
jgi:hypothetical protein